MKDKTVTGFPLIFGYLGQFLLLIGLITLVPLIMLAFYPNEYLALFPFLFTAAIDFVLGFFLHFFFLAGKARVPFARHQDSHLLVMVWLCAIISGALPFFIAHMMGAMNMCFPEAFFESASAYTTTGLTTFKDFTDGRVAVLESGSTILQVGESFCPHVYTFHRAFMQFIGGMGLVLLVASILGGGNGVSLYESEGHSDKLLPNIAKSAKLIFGIYSLYTVIGTISLWICGLPWFDATTTAMSALSGGGFNCRSSNIAYYRNFDGVNTLNGVTTMNSLAVEIIMMILVMLSAISFVLHTFLLRGKFKLFFKDDENKMFFLWIIFMTACAFFGVCITFNNGKANLFENAGEYLRDSAFYVVGSITTSGFCNTAADSAYALGNLGRPLLMICTFCMLIGGGMGSTAGGIKMYRIVLCVKEFTYYIRTKFASPHQRFPKTTFRHGSLKDVDEGAAKEAHMYLVLFLSVFVICTAIITFLPGYGPDNYGVESAALDVASAISNTGIALNDFASYGALHPVAGRVAWWTLSIGMILGRLEILPLGYWFRNIRLEMKVKRDSKRASMMISDVIE